ncbi:MAG: hypothetical protein WAL15_04085, partial [Xanthobacteraceae bacterium]
TFGSHLTRYFAQRGNSIQQYHKTDSEKMKIRRIYLLFTRRMRSFAYGKLGPRPSSGWVMV